MPSIFSKNAIISGEIDYYCLVCDDKLCTVDVVNSHIQNNIHKINLDERSFYVENYESEKIRKVNRGYYCEYCNILLTSSLKISFHVKLKSHDCNKSDNVDMTSVNRHAKWYENSVIIFDHILVTEKAWNGLIDNNCAYCNIEFDNEDLHKMESNHILNLIQAQLLVGDKRSVYRKVDNHTFHCITCNEVLSLPAEIHFEKETHNELYIQCRRDKAALYDKIQKKTLVTETTKKHVPNENLSQKEELTKPKEDDNEFNHINKKYEDEEPYATKVSDDESDIELILLDDYSENATILNENNEEISTTIIQSTIESDVLNNIADLQVSESENEQQTTNVANTSTNIETNNTKQMQKEDPLKFASENHIYYNFLPNQAYCRICKTQIPNRLYAMKEHAKGARHTRNTPDTNVKIASQPPYRTESLEDFIESLSIIESVCYVNIVLNKKFCINPRSFHFISRTVDRMRCHMCEKSLLLSNVNDHIVLDQHNTRLRNTPVIISEETEFIRIPRDGIFHCGLCNVILASWDDVQNHMKSVTHKKSKVKSNWNLKKLLPIIAAKELQDQFFFEMILLGILNNV